MPGCTRYADKSTPDQSWVKPVIFTENAAKKVAALIQTQAQEEQAQDTSNDLKLRVYIESGGCSGLQYAFTFDETVRHDDHVTVTCGVSLLIDARSFKYLSGACIDYVEDLEGERFLIDNPNASKACGCGASFDIENPPA